MTFLKSKLFAIILSLLIVVWCVCPWHNYVKAEAPKYNQNFASDLKKDGWVLNPENFNVNSDKTLRQNVVEFFYPIYDWVSKIYEVLRGITLWVIIIVTMVHFVGWGLSLLQ